MSIMPKIKAEPYAWPVNSEISAKNTALVIIDMQADCKPPFTPTPSPTT